MKAKSDMDHLEKLCRSSQGCAHLGRICRESCDGVDLDSNLVQLAVDFILAYQVRHSVLPNAAAIDDFVQRQLQQEVPISVSRFWSLRIMVIMVMTSLVPTTDAALHEYPGYYTERHIQADVNRFQKNGYMDEEAQAEISTWLNAQKSHLHRGRQPYLELVDGPLHPLVRTLYPYPIGRNPRPFLQVSIEEIEEQVVQPCLQIVQTFMKEYVVNPDVIEVLMKMNIYFINSDIDAHSRLDKMTSRERNVMYDVMRRGGGHPVFKYLTQRQAIEYWPDRQMGIFDTEYQDVLVLLKKAETYDWNHLRNVMLHEIAHGLFFYMDWINYEPYIDIDQGYNNLEESYQSFLGDLLNNDTFRNDTAGSLVHDPYSFRSNESKVHLLLIWFVKVGLMPHEYLNEEEQFLHNLISQKESVRRMFDIFESYIQQYFQMHTSRPKHFSVSSLKKSQSHSKWGGYRI